MPDFESNGVRLHYESHGSGPRCALLVTGLGFGGWSWWRQVDGLSGDMRVVTIDNRGAGLSAKPDEPYTIAGMADDAAALLDHLGIERAGVFGVSMGGYIAQELALRHRSRVDALVLGCTSFGGPNAVPLSADILETMNRNASVGWVGTAMEEAYRLRFSDRFLIEQKDAVAELVERTRQFVPPYYAWLRQAVACGAHDTESRLGSLDVPTLVLSGTDDAIVPSVNSTMLAERIPGATIEFFDGGRHFFFVEFADEVNRLVHEFFTKHVTISG